MHQTAGARGRATADRRDRPAGPWLEMLLREVERTTVDPLLAVVRANAEAEVRRCVRDVMVGATFGSYRSSDLLVVLYRDGSMVL